jgi:peroxiredoxin
MTKNYKIATIVCLTICICLMTCRGEFALAGTSIGSKAPDFSIPDAVTGDAVSLKSLLANHKAAVIIFVSTQCPYSKAYNSRMTSLFTKYGALGVSVVGIDSNVEEEEADVVEYKFEQHLPFPILKDDRNVVADKFKATHTPEAYLIDSTETLVYHGRIDNSVEQGSVKTHDLSDAIDDVLAGKPILVPETKAFGCSIKRLEDQ